MHILLVTIIALTMMFPPPQIIGDPLYYGPRVYIPLFRT